MGDQPPRVLGEHAQQIELDRRQVNLLAVFGAPRDPPGRPPGRRPARPRSPSVVVRAPENCTQPGEQLLSAEWLGDVVVGAGVERPDLLALVADRREHDDRHLAPAPDLLADVDAAPSGRTRSSTIASGGRTETASSASCLVLRRLDVVAGSARITFSPRTICGSSSTTSTCGPSASCQTPAGRRAGTRRRTRSRRPVSLWSPIRAAVRLDEALGRSPGPGRSRRRGRRARGRRARRSAPRSERGMPSPSVDRPVRSPVRRRRRR